MVTDGQVRKLLQELERGRGLALAARRSGMDEKTGRRYRSLGVLPSARKQPRTYRTRPDPFADVWSMVQIRLEAEPLPRISIWAVLKSARRLSASRSLCS